MSETTLNDPLTEAIIGCCLEVHRYLGPGLLESVYEACLTHELERRGVPFERQTVVPVRYKGVELECGYRLDLLVDRQVIVEVKAVERILPVHEAQLLTYLRLTGSATGLLVNFHVPALRRGGLRRLTWRERR